MTAHGGNKAAVLPFGIAAVDGQLPGGGLCRGHLHEIIEAGEHAGIAALFAAGILARLSGPVPKSVLRRHNDIASRAICCDWGRRRETRPSTKPDRDRHFHVSSVRTMPERNARHHGGIAALGLAALGVVFGDIGTSPLYTLKTVLDLTGDGSPATVLGVLSLIVWTLIVITSVKYVTIAMRVDNDGEGGILALMALLGVKRLMF
jgi:hypothetical protein